MGDGPWCPGQNEAPSNFEVILWDDDENEEAEYLVSIYFSYYDK